MADLQDGLDAFVPDSKSDDPVAYARETALPVLRTVRRIALGGGGRGAREQLTASKLLLEVAKLLGPQREEPAKLDAVKEAAKVIYLVDAEKAQELLAAQRAAERKP
jgi:hypothetical protein